jgi:hypothetical protein
MIQKQKTEAAQGRAARRRDDEPNHEDHHEDHEVSK